MVLRFSFFVNGVKRNVLWGRGGRRKQGGPLGAMYGKNGMIVINLFFIVSWCFDISGFFLASFMFKDLSLLELCGLIWRNIWSIVFTHVLLFMAEGNCPNCGICGLDDLYHLLCHQVTYWFLAVTGCCSTSLQKNKGDLTLV